MGNRSKSREIVLQILFWLSFDNKKKIDDYEEVVEDFKLEFEKNDYGIDVKFLNREFCLDVLSGIKFNQLEIDELIQRNLKKWKLERLSKIDLSVLRLATYEMKFNSLNPRIAINEALELVKKYGSDKSVAYVKGVLNSIKDIILEDNQKIYEIEKI